MNTNKNWILMSKKWKTDGQTKPWNFNQTWRETGGYTERKWEARTGDSLIHIDYDLFLITQHIITVTWWETKIYHGLKTRMKLHKEGRFARKSKHSLLHHSALNVIILDDYVLLKNLDGIQFICSFSLGKHHLQADM